MIMVLSSTSDVSIDNYEEGMLYFYLLENPLRQYNGVSRYFFSSTANNPTRWHVEHAGKVIYSRIYALWNRNASQNDVQFFENPVNKHKIVSGYVGSNVFKITLPTEFK